MNMDVGGVGVRLCQYADKNKEYYFSYTKTDANFYKKTSQNKTLIYTDDIFISIVILDISNAPLSFLIFRNVYIGGQKWHDEHDPLLNFWAMHIWVRITEAHNYTKYCAVQKPSHSLAQISGFLNL